MQVLCYDALSVSAVQFGEFATYVGSNSTKRGLVTLLQYLGKAFPAPDPGVASFLSTSFHFYWRKLLSVISGSVPCTYDDRKLAGCCLGIAEQLFEPRFAATRAAAATRVAWFVAPLVVTPLSVDAATFAHVGGGLDFVGEVRSLHQQYCSIVVQGQHQSLERALIPGWYPGNLAPPHADAVVDIEFQTNAGTAVVSGLNLWGECVIHAEQFRSVVDALVPLGGYQCRLAGFTCGSITGVCHVGLVLLDQTTPTSSCLSDPGLLIPDLLAPGVPGACLSAVNLSPGQATWTATLANNWNLSVLRHGSSTAVQFEWNSASRDAESLSALGPHVDNVDKFVLNQADIKGQRQFPLKSATLCLTHPALEPRLLSGSADEAFRRCCKVALSL